MLNKMSLAQRKRVFNLVLAMSLITLLSLVSVFRLETIQRNIHFNAFEQQESTSFLQQEGLKWRSRRLLQGGKERPAPRGYPPPDGNALIHDPQKAPPGKTAFFDNTKKPAAAWIPDNPSPLQEPPPPHP